MSEERFTLHELVHYDEGQEKWVDCDRYCITDNETHINYDLKFNERQLCDLLNEQQELIEELQVSDEMGWKRAGHFEKKCPKEFHNKKMYIKRLEYKVEKFKEMNGEQQSTINELKEEMVRLHKMSIELMDRVIPNLRRENEQLRQVVEEYRKTNKHLSELCADASKNGYLPPLEDLQ